MLAAVHLPSRALAAATVFLLVTSAPESLRAQTPDSAAKAGATASKAGDSTTTDAKPAAPASDDPVARIREEGLNRSQVMATLSYLTDVTGPRLTGSPGLLRASEWSRDRLASWGLVNAHLEPWGPFGRGWLLKRFSAQVVAPQSIPLIAFPKAWSPSLGTKALEADIVHVDIKKAEDFEKFRGKLKGKIVLDGPVQDMKMRFESIASRRTDANLLALANSDGIAASGRPSTAPSTMITPEQRAATALLPRRYQFYSEEGVAVLLQPSRLGEAGNFFTSAATVYPPRGAPGGDAAAAEKKSESTKKKSSLPLRGVSPWKTDAPPIVPQITLAAEHYNRLVRMIEQGEKLRMAVELQAEYQAKNPMSANVVAEIPGSDLASEVVMLGAHLDSWHSATGATDNAAGCAVAMEAVRILQALDLKPRRTIRVALWTGEEQGLLGSKAYVAEHFGAPKTATATPSATRDEADPFAVTPRSSAVVEIDKKPEHAQVSAYFNLDNGGGKIRGVYLQNNEAARPIFRQWLKPFKDLGAETVSLSSTGGTDHLSFDNVGLPGFQFIQDEIEYGTRTHHGNMDLYDRTIADDLKQASAVMAAFVYQTAMRDEKIPRKPAAVAPRPSTPAGTMPAAPGGSGSNTQ